MVGALTFRHSGLGFNQNMTLTMSRLSLLAMFSTLLLEILPQGLCFSPPTKHQNFYFILSDLISFDL